MNIVAQIIGLIASIIMVSSTQIKNNKNKLLIFYMIGYSLHVMSFIILQAYAGAISCLVSAIETIVIYKFELNKKILTFFIILTIIAGIISFTNIYSILPILSGFVFIRTIIEKDMAKIRKLTLLSRILWSVYEFIVHSYSVLAFDIVAISSTIIAIIRYDIISKTKKNVEKEKLKLNEDELVPQ